MLTREEERKYKMAHFVAGHPGNADEGDWAVLCDVPNWPEYCRLVPVTVNGIGNQAFLSWRNSIKSSQTHLAEGGTQPELIPEQFMRDLTQLRADVKSGKKRVVDSHIRFAK